MPEDLTVLLQNVRLGDRDAEAKLIALVYDELRLMASRQIHREKPGHTLQTTALVHEAYLRLFTQSEVEWKDRTHFFAMASQVMRHVLIDYARANRTAKRGGGCPMLPLDEAFVISEDRLDELLQIEDALVRLEQQDARAVQVLVMRFYGGLNLEEIADALQVSTRTVKRDWNYCRAWLKAELTPERPSDAQPRRSD